MDPLLPVDRCPPSRIVFRRAIPVAVWTGEPANDGAGDWRPAGAAGDWPPADEGGCERRLTLLSEGFCDAVVDTILRYVRQSICG